MNKNLIRTTTDLAMHIVSAYIEPGDLVIDATCGNGHDTLELAKLVGQKGQVLAFDIQESAIESTRQLLEGSTTAGSNLLERVRLICDSHEYISDYLSQDHHAKAIVFNLGYLPGGDKSLTTSIQSTMSAVKNALDLIVKDGILCITMYSGHEAGALEKKELLHFAEALDSRNYHVSYVNMLNQQNNPPEILLISPKK